MIEFDDLKRRFAKRLRESRLRRSLELTDDGFFLGAGALLASRALDGEELRMIAMLTAAYRRLSAAQVLEAVRKSANLWSRGEKCLAQLHLNYAGLPPLANEQQAFAIFAADELLKAGLSPRALLKGLDAGSFDLLKRYNPDQPRVPAGNGRESGRWGSGGVGGTNGRRQYAQADDPPPLRRIHPDSTYESDPQAKRSLEHWRNQPTTEIIQSLKPGLSESLKVKPDGAIVNGNTRIKVLQERGLDVNALARERHGQGFSGEGQLNIVGPAERGGGGAVRILPTED